MPTAYQGFETLLGRDWSTVRSRLDALAQRFVRRTDDAEAIVLHAIDILDPTTFPTDAAGAQTAVDALRATVRTSAAEALDVGATPAVPASLDERPLAAFAVPTSDALPVSPVREALGSLPQVQRDAVLARVVTGYHASEVADALGVDHRTAAAAIRAGRRALRAEVRAVVLDRAGGEHARLARSGTQAARAHVASCALCRSVRHPERGSAAADGEQSARVVEAARVGMAGAGVVGLGAVGAAASGDGDDDAADSMPAAAPTVADADPVGGSSPTASSDAMAATVAAPLASTDDDVDEDADSAATGTDGASIPLAATGAAAGAAGLAAADASDDSSSNALTPGSAAARVARRRRRRRGAVTLAALAVAASTAVAVAVWGGDPSSSGGTGEADVGISSAPTDDVDPAEDGTDDVAPPPATTPSSQDPGSTDPDPTGPEASGVGTWAPTPTPTWSDEDGWSTPAPTASTAPAWSPAPAQPAPAPTSAPTQAPTPAPTPTQPPAEPEPTDPGDGGLLPLPLPLPLPELPLPSLPPLPLLPLLAL